MDNRTENILGHMIEDAHDIVKFARMAASFEEFSSNSLYRKGIAMSIINIGELAKHLPDEFLATYREIPWKKITGMRNLAAHGYREMDNKIIWDVAVHSIPELLTFLQKHFVCDEN